MPISGSSTKSVSKRFRGFKVLLIESDKKSLQHHAYVLLQNSFRVTSTMKISEALSMITSGNTYDCVLIDAENRDMDLVDFLRMIWSHQPQLRIIVMTSNEFHMQLGRETPEDDTIWFLRKPCGGSIICNMVQHVCKKRLAIGENQETQMVDNMNPSTIFNITMINNNTSSSNATHQSLNINSQKYGDMSKPAAHVDISSDDNDNDDDDDHEAATNKNFCTSSPESKDKGKQPMELKRKDRANKRIAWTAPLHGKFLEALTLLGKEGVYPRAILKHMNVPGLTRAQVASHLQRIQERQNFIMKPKAVSQIQKDNNLDLDSHACKRSRLSTPSDHNKASRINCSSNQRALVHNFTGISCMTLENIKDKLQRDSQVPLPQKTTTTMISNNQAKEQHCFGEQFQPLIDGTSTGASATVESKYNLGTDVFIFPNGFDNVNFVGARVDLARFDRFGIPIESSVTVDGGIEAPLNVGGMDDLAFPEFISHDMRGVCHPQQSQRNREILFDVENSDTVNFGHESTSLYLHNNSCVENKVQPHGNSIVPLDGSEGRIIDNDWYMNLLHQEDEDLFLCKNMSYFGS